VFKQEPVKYAIKESSEDTKKLETTYKMKDEATNKEMFFKFYWILKKCAPGEVSIWLQIVFSDPNNHLFQFASCLTNPLIKTVMEQELKIAELKKIISAKDLEINQYKNSGAHLIIGKISIKTSLQTI
jgi:hypothetical protein